MDIIACVICYHFSIVKITIEKNFDELFELFKNPSLHPNHSVRGLIFFNEQANFD